MNTSSAAISTAAWASRIPLRIGDRSTRHSALPSIAVANGPTLIEVCALRLALRSCSLTLSRLLAMSR